MLNTFNELFTQQSTQSQPMAPYPEQRRNTGSFPKFYKKQVLDSKKTEEAGRPIYKEIDYVEVRLMGDTRTVINKKVEEEDKFQWRLEWEHFCRTQTTPLVGTPLKEWGAIPLTIVKEYEHFNIFTVEQLADVNPSFLANMGPGVDGWVKKAKAYLEAGPRQSMINENAKLKEQGSIIEIQLGKLKEENDNLFSELQLLRQEAKSNKMKVESLEAEKEKFQSEKIEITRLVERINTQLKEEEDKVIFLEEKIVSLTEELEQFKAEYQAEEIKPTKKKHLFSR